MNDRGVWHGSRLLVRGACEAPLLCLHMLRAQGGISLITMHRLNSLFNVRLVWVLGKDEYICIHMYLHLDLFGKKVS